MSIIAEKSSLNELLVYKRTKKRIKKQAGTRWEGIKKVVLQTQHDQTTNKL